MSGISFPIRTILDNQNLFSLSAAERAVLSTVSRACHQATIWPFILGKSKWVEQLGSVIPPPAPPPPMCNFRLDKHWQRKHTLCRECELVGLMPTAFSGTPQRGVFLIMSGHLVSKSKKLTTFRGRCPKIFPWIILLLGKHKGTSVDRVQGDNFST